MDSRHFGRLLKRFHNEEAELHKHKQGSYAPGDDDVLTNFKDQAKTVKLASDMHAVLSLMEKHRLALLEVALGNVEEEEHVIWERVRDIRLYMALFYGLWVDSNQDKIPEYIDFYEDLGDPEFEEENLADWEAAANSPLLGCLIEISDVSDDCRKCEHFPSCLLQQVKAAITEDPKAQEEVGEERDEAAIEEWVRSGWEAAKHDGSLDAYSAAIEGAGPVAEGLDEVIEKLIEDGDLIEVEVPEGMVGPDEWKEAGGSFEDYRKIIDAYADTLEDDLKVPDDVLVPLDGPMTFEEWDALREDPDAPDLLQTPKIIDGEGASLAADCARFPESCGDCSLDMCNAHPSNRKLGPANLLDKTVTDYIQENRLSLEETARLRQDIETGEVHMIEDEELIPDRVSNDAEILAKIQEACEELGVEGFEEFNIDPRIEDLRKRADEIEALTNWLQAETEQLRADTLALQEEKEEDGGGFSDSVSSNWDNTSVRHTDRDVPEPIGVVDDSIVGVMRAVGIKPIEIELEEGVYDLTMEQVDEVLDRMEEDLDLGNDFASKWGTAPDQ